MLDKWDEDVLAYMAGFMDGEGTFTAYGPYHKIIVTATNTYKPIILWLKETFGGSVTRSFRKNNPKHRQTWQWALVGPMAVELCRRLAPYLREKAEQAGLLIAIHQLKKFPGHTIPPGIRAERDRLALILKGCKHVAWD